MSPQPPAGRDYWAELSTRQLIDGYLKPHAGKLEDEGLYVGAIAIREAIRRLEELTPMNTDARRKAADTYAKKRKDAGWAKRTVWFSPEALARLAELEKIHGSKDAALNAVLTQAPQKPHQPPPPSSKPRTEGKGKKAASEAPASSGAAVQIGPVRAKPGERLKKR